jgi:NADH:ubiquinone oxidoreductase subunit E
VSDFAFTPENDARATEILKRYPSGREASAVLPLLQLAQDQAGGWLPQPALDFVADCRTTPCWLCGSDEVLRACQDVLGIEVGGSTPDGRFFLREFECLGACANAPMMWIDDDYYEDLTYENARAVIEALKNGERPTPGSQTGRKASMPAGGKTTLHEDPNRIEPEPKEGPGDRDQAPVKKGRPRTEVKEHAAKTEAEGRPADRAGEPEAGQEDGRKAKGRRKGSDGTDAE